LFSIPFSPGEGVTTDCRGWVASARSVSSLQLWSSRGTHRSPGIPFTVCRRQTGAFVLGDPERHGCWYASFPFSSRCPLKTVKLENGELTTTETQRQQRWQEHFCRVAAGKLHPDPAYLISVPQVGDSRVDTNDYVDFSPPRYPCCDEIVAISQRVRSRFAARWFFFLKASGMSGASALLMCVDGCTWKRSGLRS